MNKLIISDRISKMEPSATLKMAAKAREFSDKGIDVVVMSAGEPDFTTPKCIIDVAKASLDQGKTHYSPIRGNKGMIKALQHKFLRDQKVEYAENEVMCTVGAKSAIMMALTSIINPLDEVIIFAPYWVSYKEQIALAGGIPVIVEGCKENSFIPSKEDIKKAITKKTKAIIINSPNNPSGSIMDKNFLLDLALLLQNTNIWLISDEIYEKLLFDGATHYSPSALSEDMRARTVVISGVSKAYAMTGWRVGFAAGPKEIISAMAILQGQETTCLPDFIQDAASFAIMEPQEVLKEISLMKSSYSQRRDLALEKISKIKDLWAFKPKGAFYLWVDFNKICGQKIKGQPVIDDMDLSMRILSEAHVACVPGTPFGGKGFLRFSLASSPKDIELGFTRIGHWLNS